MKDLKRNRVLFSGLAVDPSAVDPEDVEMIDRPDNTYDSWEIADYDNPVAGITVANVDNLIGKLFIQTELLNLPERQYNAYKKIVRELFWEWFNSNLPNPTGLADVSHQARVSQGIEK